MINTDELLNLYVGISMLKNRNLYSIYESMGISSEVIGSAEYVTHQYLDYFKTIDYKYGVSIYKNIVTGRESDFFSDVEFTTSLRYIPYESYGPNVKFMDESFFDESGYHIKINVYMRSDPFEFKDVLFEEIGHEIAHAYDDYNELKSNNMKYSRFRDDSFRNLEKMNNYMLNSTDKDIRKFGLLLHMIDEVETIGYQHEIASEIFHADFSCYGKDNAKEFNKFLMKTYVMGRIIDSENYINEIEESDDENFKSKILCIFNDVYGKKYDYEKMISFIKYRFMKVRKKILQAAGGAFVSKMEMRLDRRSVDD